MITETQARDVIGATAYGSDGEKIGKVGQLFLDDQTGRPEFVTVNTGLFGMKETFVPVAQAEFNGTQLRLPYTKDRIKDAPNVDLDGGHLEQSEENRLYEYYGLSRYASETRSETGAGMDTDDAMTRSEERLEAGTTSQEAGRVRLRKYVTTETGTRTVPVAEERAVVGSEPVERVRLGTETTVDEQTVTEDVRKEHIEVEGDVDDRRT